MHRLIYYFSVTSDIVLRRYYLILFKLENDRSGEGNFLKCFIILL